MQPTNADAAAPRPRPSLPAATEIEGRLNLHHGMPSTGAREKTALLG
jgi:hypothetical protein